MEFDSGKLLGTLPIFAVKRGSLKTEAYYNLPRGSYGIPRVYYFGYSSAELVSTHVY